MDRRSWLWSRKSSEKSPGETECSGSLSSHSERFSDDQEVSKVSPNHIQSLEVSLNTFGGEVHDNMKSITEKLSAALSNISAKEELVRQHAKVAEEAVSGWEKAETEVIALKQQLEAATQKNSALEDRVGHLDSALKECMRQLWQAREENEQKLHETITKKTLEWESSKSGLESQLNELQIQLNSAKANAVDASVKHDLQLKLEAVEKENSALKLELCTQAEELKFRTLERELSTRAAETASRQHLQSIKKVAKLEAKCRKIQAAACKGSSINDHKSILSSFYVGPCIDNQSVSGKQLLAVKTDIQKMGGFELTEYEPSCSDSWASTLTAEFDQFKNKKVISRNLSVVSPDMEFMDDFLEMEKLSSLVDMEKDGHDSEFSVITDSVDRDNSSSNSELEALLQKTANLEEKLQKLEGEKAALDLALTARQDQLETSQSQLMKAEKTLMELQWQLASADELRKSVEVELEAANAMRKDAESQLKAVNVEVQTLLVRVDSLELEVKEEQALSKEVAMKCHKLEDELSRKIHGTELWQAVDSYGDLDIKHEKELAVAAGKLAECQKTIASLGKQLKALATLEDLFDSDMSEPNEVPPVLSGEQSTSYSNEVYCSKKVEPSNTVDDYSPSNSKDEELPSSSSSSTNHDSEKSRNGFRKLFFRNKNGSSPIENQ